MKTRLRVISTVAWFGVSLLLLVGPGFARWGNHATPRVLGLPWSHAWVWGVVVANFFVLVLVHATRWLDGELDEERPARPRGGDTDVGNDVPSVDSGGDPR